VCIVCDLLPAFTQARCELVLLHWNAVNSFVEQLKYLGYINDTKLVDGKDINKELKSLFMRTNLSARSVPTLGHIKDRTSGPLPPRWKRRDWPSPTWDRSDSSKTSSRTPGTTRNGPRFHGWGYPPVEDEVDRHHPTALCNLGELPTCFFDGLDLSEASPDPSHHFPRGGS